VFESIRGTLALLDPRSRRILWLLVLVQVALAFLDMIGVLLFGVVAALSASAISGEDPTLVSGILSRFGVGEQDLIQVAVALAFAAGTLFMVKSIVSFLMIRRAYRFLANRQAMVSSRLASRLLSRPLLDVQRLSSQERSYALVQGANAATIGVLGSAVVIVSEVAVLAVLFAGILVVDWVVAVFTVVFFAIVGLVIYRVLGSWAKRLGEKLSTTEIESITSVQNAIRTYREVTVTGRRGIYIERFRNLRWRAASVQADLQILAQIPKYVFEVALIIGGGLLAISQFLTRDVVSAVAIIAVFLTAATRIMPSLLRFQTAAITVRSQSGVAAPTLALAAELHNADGENREVLDAELQERVLSGLASEYKDFKPAAVLEKVSLSYPGADRQALGDVSFSVDEGQSLALVGPTGAGKSTIADVILGVIQPDLGAVTLSGVSPTEAAMTWPGAIAYVPQDTTVLDGTIRQNVGLGLPENLIRDDLVWEALERAHLADMLRSEREGLDTVVGEHGVRLSGGQRQRLGLARALYTRPRLIVLDEATSALDAETERAISIALGELQGSVTLVIIAHRLATVQHCDHVVYLEDGRIMSSGTFDEVRRVQPRFNRQAELLGL